MNKIKNIPFILEVKRKLNRLTVWLTILATILWSIGLPTSFRILPTRAAGPTIVRVEKVNPTAVEVRFSAEVKNATTTSNYTFSDGLSVVDVMQQSPDLYRVIASGDITTGSTTITVSANVQNMASEANTDTGAKAITESPKIKISEIMIGTASSSLNEFVELYNSGGTPVDLESGGYIVNVRDADGTSTPLSLTFATSTIPAFGFFLIASSQYSDIGVTPDATYSATTTSQLTANGSVNLYISTTTAIDVVGWGSQPIGLEGTAAPSTSVGQSLERKAFGSSDAIKMATGGQDASMGNGWDSNSNYFDFVVTTSPNPQNSTSIEQPNFDNYQGLAGSGPMIMHMPPNLAPTGSYFNILAQMGDPQTPIDQIVAELHYMAGDGTPGDNTTANYTTIIGTHQSNGYFRFTIPQATIDTSTSSGLYYYLKVTSNSGTKLMSGSASADLSGLESAVAQNPLIISVQSGAGWTKHNITGTINDQESLPISGALVFLEGTGYSTTTAANGTFTLSNVKDNTYNLIIVKDGYYESSFMNLFLNGADFSIGTYALNAGTGGGMSGDSTKPTIKWTGPMDGMFGAPPGTENFKVFIGFSKDMDSSTVNNSNIYLSTDGSTPISSAVTYDNTPDNNPADYPRDPYLGVVFMPTGGLAANTTYYLIMNGSVRDTSGNALQGNRAQGGHVISFTTGGNFMSGEFDPNAQGSWTDFGSGEMKPPFVMGTTPNDGTMNVVPNIKVNISFSDPMDSTSVTTSGNIKLYRLTVSNNAETATAVSISTTMDTSQKTAIITPASNLSAGKYRVVVTGAVKSATGIFMGNPGSSQNTSSYESFRSHFDVGANISADTTKPTIKGTWPINGDTGIAVNPGALNIQFSEAMDPTSINSNTVTLKRGTTQVTGNVTYDSMSYSASFAPNVVLTTDTNYTLTITGGATSTSATDIVGNPLAGDYAVVFTTSSTGDTQTPKIMFANGDEYSVAITFSEPMNSAKITDSANWTKSILNPTNYAIVYGTPGTATNTWATTTLANSSFNYDGPTNTVTIKNLGLTLEQIGGKDYYINMSSTSASDLSGNTLATVTYFQAPIKNSFDTKGMLGPMMGGGMTGGMMGPDMGMMGMMKAGVFPMNAMAGQTTIYFVDVPTSRAIAAGDKIVLTFPAGFNVAGAKKDTNSPVNSDVNEWNTGTISFSTDAETSGGANNDGVTVDSAARTITINLAVSGSTPTSDFLHLDIAGIVNSSIPRGFETSGYSVDIKIMDSNGSLKESVSGMPFFINEGGALTLSGTITLTGADGSTDGTMNLYIGSPMTGPMDTTVTITDGSGSYSLTGLTAGNYMMFTDPVVTINSVDWNGMTMPEPLSITASTTKNLTFTKQNSGSVMALTVNLSGNFGGNDIDVFAGSPIGFKVKTITNATSSPSPVILYLPQSEWMIGVGPAMPKGPMAGPPPMPDWMPPMPQLIKSTGTGTSSVTLSISSASMQIIGYVTDGVATSSYPNGSPIADAQVFAYQPMGAGGMGSNAKTDTSGKFTLKTAQAGNYTVGVFKQGLPNVPERSVIVSAENAITGGNADGNDTADITVDNRLITSATSSQFVFKLKKADTTISGKVTNGTSAVASAPVWAYQADGYGHADTMTDSSGNYILYVGNGTWVVNSYVPGYGDAEQQTVVINGSSATQNLAPSSGTTFYTIEGTVTMGGQAQANMPIRAVQFNNSGVYTSKEFTGQTASDGTYSISVPGNNKYRVDLWTPTYGEIGLNTDEVANSPANVIINTSNVTGKDITVATENLVTFTISLTNKSGYAGKEGFLNIEGVSCTGATCKPSDYKKSLRISDLSGTDQTVQLKATSTYFFFLDVPGFGHFIPDLDASTGRDSTTDTVIATSTNRTVKFTLLNATSTTATVSGTVTNDSSAAIANTWVWINNPSNGYFAGTSTDSNGAYALSVPAGSSYKIGAEKNGYMSGEPASLDASASTTKNITLTANSLTISGYIYTDTNSNGSYDSGEGVAGWVRAQTTDSSKKTHAPADSTGYYELGVVNGTWTVYGVGNGFTETQFSSNITVSGSNATSKNISMTTDANWSAKSKMKPITPASGGTLDDTGSSGTGIKLTVPPNALGSSASTGNITAEMTAAVVKTNSTEPFGNKGTNITAADNSGQAITNLNDYIDIEKVIYKADIVTEIAAGNTTYVKMKNAKNSYWDSTLNDWVNLNTTRAAYYKTSADDTEWTSYNNIETDDDFEAFIDTVIAGTSYYDYKLVLTSKTNHFTTFAVTTPFIAAAASSPSSPSSPSSSGGGGAVSSSYCADVVYEEWQNTCANYLQYRNIKSQTPAGCILTAEQEKNRSRSCNTMEQPLLKEIITDTKKQITETTEATSQKAKEYAQKIMIIASEATDLVKANVNAILGKLGIKRNLAKENVSVKKYVKELVKDIRISSNDTNALTNFVTYGTETTKILGEGERAGVVNSYKSAFGKLPTTENEWNDAIKIANGRWPSQKNAKTEENATDAFKKIYKRAPDRANQHDDAAVTIIAYGLRPAQRNINSEKAAIKIFKAIYGYEPKSATAWDIVRAIAYSGAKR